MASSSAGGNLFESSDCKQWQASLDSYEELLDLVSSQKKKRSEKDSLTNLDKWYQTGLPSSVASRSQPHLTLQELSKLMQWKLTRGKFRPRLMELVKQNSSAEVETITGAAISALPDLEKAITIASKLKGVGPATASAILCAASSDVPFMSDESVQSIPGIGKLTYTLKQYVTYAEALQEKAKQLTTSGDGDTGEWCAHDVELALWSHHHSNLLTSTHKLLGKRKTNKRPADAANLDDSNLNTSTISIKKRRLSNSP